ncbi:WbqC family protein [Polaromonas sp. YR568]|uniref:WbqC family protein n=1 Tax=Polaromonas sp. YR568 TaxID=1855301 RepID=UPI00398BCBF4
MGSLAIMQPYFFPYLGYWQLIKAVDKFVVYNDVNYITRGWVNRNRILVNGQAHYITVPLKHASQNRLICEIELDTTSAWREKLLKTISLSYRKSPHFLDVFPVIEGLIRQPATTLSEYLGFQLRTLAGHMGITTTFGASEQYGNRDISGTDRILNICKLEGALTYVNAPGGRQLYDPAVFSGHGIKLRFLNTRPLAYAQRAEAFTPHLSIIDLLMENGFSKVSAYLDEFDLLA